MRLLTLSDVQPSALNTVVIRRRHIARLSILSVEMIPAARRMCPVSTSGPYLLLEVLVMLVPLDVLAALVPLEVCLLGGKLTPILPLMPRKWC